MKTLIYVLVLLLFCFSCNQKKKTDKKYSFQKIEYKKQNESFDSTFIVNGNKVRLTCNTECFNDFSIADTINDSTINLYQDRFLKFVLTSNVIDTQIVVSKEIIKDIYNNNSTFKSSVLAFPRIEKINYNNNSIEIHSLFLFPSGLIGTNFLEEISFEISLKGKVSFNEVLMPPEKPDSLNTNSL
ncbi:MAG: hypothetical protein Q8T08_16615 [Ignavibacteria bacterium]|nr:hypothetical protein [Ignavibacteria bacterium]